MAEKPFRVLLDLIDLHIDNIKYVWMNVSPQELQTISDFKSAIVHKLNLEREYIKLYIRGGLLLEQETIIVLREDDTVKVKYEEPTHLLSANYSDRESKNVRRKRCSSESNTTTASVSKKRCKTDAGVSGELNDTSTSEMNQCKKKKRKKSLSTVPSEEVVDPSETLETSHNEVQGRKKKKKESASLSSSTRELNSNQDCESFFSLNKSNTVSEYSQNNTFAVNPDTRSNNSVFESTKDSSEVNIENGQISKMDISQSVAAEAIKQNENTNNSLKKKRKRHRKRKTKELPVCDFISAETKFVSCSDSNDKDVKRKHIVYSPVSREKESGVLFDVADNIQNSSKETFIANQVKCNGNAQFVGDYPRVSTPAQSDGCINPDWHVSVMQSKNSTYSNESMSFKKGLTSDVATQEKPVKENVSLQNSKISSYEVQYDDLPPLNSVPKVGTHLVYKTLELDESYSPVISDYREGIVQNVKPDTEEVEIELVKHLIKPGRTGKFENLKEDEIPYPEIKKYDVLRWSAIISPKQLS